MYPTNKRLALSGIYFNVLASVHIVFVLKPLLLTTIFTIHTFVYIHMSQSIKERTIEYGDVVAKLMYVVVLMKKTLICIFAITFFTCCVEIINIRSIYFRTIIR